MSDLVLVRTRPGAHFKSLSGQNNHFLITILVGLDAVKSGSVTKHPEFSTTWSPHDHAASAGRSRAYAIRTSLVWITDLLNVYRRAATRIPGICTDIEIAKIEGGPDDGSSKRLERLGRHLGMTPSPQLRLAQLAIHWRNKVAHSEAITNLDGAVKGGLRSTAEAIAGTHAGLNVDEMLSNEARAVAPTFKEIASLMHATHKLVEQLDRLVVARADLGALADLAISSHLHDPEGPGMLSRSEALWTEDPPKTAKRLHSILAQAGFRVAVDDDGRRLGADFLEAVASLSLEEARGRYVHERG